MRIKVIAIAGVFVLASLAPLSAQTLKGSHATMRRQNTIAQKHDYTFMRTSADVARFVDAGLLVPVQSSSTIKLSENIGFPVARPQVRTFVQRLARQYKNACGERLVITSLTRPLSRQPWNASDLSVHPAGMAVDMRVSERRSCRRWLTNTLVDLEQRGVIDATRERYPAHFHIAVFPSSYANYVAGLDAASKPAVKSVAVKSTSTDKPPVATPPMTYASMIPFPSSTPSAVARHKVRAGESLWSIAQQHGVSVTALKSANDLRGARIRAGQVLTIPNQRSANGD
jgi:LysM repeat protein